MQDDRQPPTIRECKRASFTPAGRITLRPYRWVSWLCRYLSMHSGCTTESSKKHFENEVLGALPADFVSRKINLQRFKQPSVKGEAVTFTWYVPQQVQCQLSLVVTGSAHSIYSRKVLHLGFDHVFHINFHFQNGLIFSSLCNAL